MKKIIFKNLKYIGAESTSHSVGSKKILLSSLETESMLTQAAVGSLSKGEFVHNHCHPTMEEFYFFTKGKANLKVNDIEHLCVKDTFIKIPKDSVHSLQAITNVEFIYWGIGI